MGRRGRDDPNLITLHCDFSVNGQLVALKEIRLNSEEGTPFTAIREGKPTSKRKVCLDHLSLTLLLTPSPLTLLTPSPLTSSLHHLPSPSLHHLPHPPHTISPHPPHTISPHPPHTISLTLLTPSPSPSSHHLPSPSSHHLPSPSSHHLPHPPHTISPHPPHTISLTLLTPSPSPSSHHLPHPSHTISLTLLTPSPLTYGFSPEASLLKGLKHANIVTLHDIIHTSTNLTFVFEYVVSVEGVGVRVECVIVFGW